MTSTFWGILGNGRCKNNAHSWIRILILAS